MGIKYARSMVFSAGSVKCSVHPGLGCCDPSTISAGENNFEKKPRKGTVPVIFPLFFPCRKRTVLYRQANQLMLKGALKKKQ